MPPFVLSTCITPYLSADIDTLRRDKKRPLNSIIERAIGGYAKYISKGGKPTVIETEKAKVKVKLKRLTTTISHPTWRTIKRLKLNLGIPMWKVIEGAVRWDLSLSQTPPPGIGLFKEVLGTRPEGKELGNTGWVPPRKASVLDGVTIDQITGGFVLIDSSVFVAGLFINGSVTRVSENAHWLLRYMAKKGRWGIISNRIVSDLWSALKRHEAEPTYTANRVKALCAGPIQLIASNREDLEKATGFAGGQNTFEIALDVVTAVRVSESKLSIVSMTNHYDEIAEKLGVQIFTPKDMLLPETKDKQESRPMISS